ncbi:L,D-transpeptidase [Mesorhizobium sp. M7A.F.Ca.MR.362.00.0.0]|jgi:lipoprotein-anchoring transpeptidase ErfK/SrfK|uniref:L,D-transpeptidase n=1 Tax=Mesorhizobium sp. M7A.F.Ca.MR.362.00.0.0 TaxID=2496779 RepID=UPI000FCA96F9|nr:L,D-transpeptidase [Mesorhizobium sp. M7A.F.Ca.MR.362.00.0.0]RUU82343.1 L,D-transpeptidase [Mesorhizobium sp. M7A.F.Ca.MR.362.00.0.0]RUV20091.1 L,D-transpeptidase [Mesorhizobium sp. M7A.F.Ca.MR.245.00.0.0]RUV53853.1 L,D-transpeptidase [Mesorhizobium sp. M7A.F.Ca.MR.228.00.0.0]RWN97827.1 MAG: L,D-transpeptidase [Mesorhizobium sp.]
MKLAKSKRPVRIPPVGSLAFGRSINGSVSSRDERPECIRQFVRSGFVLALAALLVGCLADGKGSPNTATELVRVKAAYAREPHEVFIVDRSKFDQRFLPVDVTPPERLPAGTVLIDTRQRFLYLYRLNGTARRYGIAVGASGYSWSGIASVGRKAEWPAWHPTDDMRNQSPDLPRMIRPGTHNPLGARALYLYKNGVDTLYRIHGTSEPWTIGTEASSGCIRMLNEDVIELYSLVPKGAKVIVK